MESLDKEKIKIKDAVKNYPRLIEEELHNIGNNVVSFCRSEKVWKHIEQKLKGGSVAEKIHSDVVPASSTVVYTQSLEKILNKYGSLDYFWEFVLRELKTAQAILILHEDEDIPHIHLLLKFKKIVSLEDVAKSLDGLFMNKDGKTEIRTNTVDYLYGNLYDSYCSVLHCDDEFGKGECGYILKITPDLAEYLIKYENIMVNAGYKEYLRKEQENYDER